MLIDDIDWNAQSLFTTPIGQTVQQYVTEMLIEKRDRTSEYAEYIQNVNDSIGNLSQSFWDIDLTIKLIEFAHPKIKSFKMTRVDRGDYLKYHFENYFFRLPKLKDQILQLLNLVYRMGFSQSKGLEKKVRAHHGIQEEKLDLFLDYVEGTISIIRPLRDTIAHRSDIKDADFAMLTSYQLVSYDQETYETQLRLMISRIFALEKTQANLKRIVILVLMAIEKDFNSILKSLSEKSRH